MKESFECNFTYEDVLKFATEKHKGQFRSDGKTPYINHPIRVCELVLKYKENSKNKDILMAGALLHDTLEDTYTSYRELSDKFGIVVASLILELSSAQYACKLEGKNKYLKYKMQYMTNYALVIKLADRLDNLKDSKELSNDKIDSKCKETIDIINHLKQFRDLTNAQKLIIQDIENVIYEDLLIKEI